MGYSFRATVFSREDGIDAMAHRNTSQWLIRDRQSPVRFWNFVTNEWDYAHLIDSSFKDLPGQYLRDQAVALQQLQTVER